MGTVNLEDALRLIAEIKSVRAFAFVMQKKTVSEAFAKISPLMPGKALYAKRTQLITSVRNKAAAHHDDQELFAKAIKDRSQNPRFEFAKAELSMEPFGTRFYVADEVFKPW